MKLLGQGGLTPEKFISLSKSPMGKAAAGLAVAEAVVLVVFATFSFLTMSVLSES